MKDEMMHPVIATLTESEATDLWIELHADPDLEQIMEEAQEATSSAREALSDLSYDPDLEPIIIEVLEAIRKGR